MADKQVVFVEEGEIHDIPSEGNGEIEKQPANPGVSSPRDHRERKDVGPFPGQVEVVEDT